jgi:uncharacterized protein YndB with AHSA1/START domain
MKPQITPAVVPVRLSVTVNASRQRAFEVFTQRMGDWWPTSSHSIAGDEVETVVLEAGEGGRIFERHRDGSEASWGVIRTWSPPERLVFSWNPSYEDRPDTEVEVTFIEISEAETRVELEHRGWDALGAAARQLRDNYEQGWPVVMGGFALFVPTD